MLFSLLSAIGKVSKPKCIQATQTGAVETGPGFHPSGLLTLQRSLHPLIPQMRNFLRSIRGQEAPINSSAQALQLMEILDAIYSSGQSGHPVSFE